MAVVELGMNHAGEIRTLVGIAEPDVRVWTNVGDAHLGFFASADAIADAKAEILEGARRTDAARGQRGRHAHHGARRARSRAGSVTFGLSDRADVRASGVEHRGRRRHRRATFTTPAGQHPRLARRCSARAICSNLLAATAVAVEMDVPLDAIAERAAALRPAPHRGELLRLPGGITLIDDSYNSSPSALAARPRGARAHSTGSARKVAVLGEMLELGDHAGAAARGRAGGAAAAAGVDLLVAVGGRARGALAEAARHAGMPARRGGLRRDDRRRRERRRARAGPPRRPRPREGIARHPHRSRGRAAQGGVRLMLYHLLYPLAHAGAGAERRPLHHVPDGGREHHRAGHEPRARPVADPAAARVPDRSGDPAGGPADAPRRRPARRRWAAC